MSLFAPILTSARNAAPSSLVAPPLRLPRRDTGDNPAAYGEGNHAGGGDDYDAFLNRQALGQGFTLYTVTGAAPQTQFTQDVDVTQPVSQSRIWELLIAGVVILVLSRIWR